MDVGRREAPGYVRTVQELRNALQRKGWTIGMDLEYFEEPGGTHNDESFGRRADRMLKFLFPAR